jgi:mono/diheme cytochrome c family protein
MSAKRVVSLKACSTAEVLRANPPALKHILQINQEVRTLNKWTIITTLLAAVAVVSIGLFAYINLQSEPSGNAQTGATLYAQYCAGCHGELAVSARHGRTATQIQTAISTVPRMQWLSGLTTQQIQDIAMALAE